MYFRNIKLPSRPADTSTSAVQLRVPIGILDVEEVGAGLGTGWFRLILQEVDHHSDNGW